jgi:CBS-domain-containing membrane protein
VLHELRSARKRKENVVNTYTNRRERQDDRDRHPDDLGLVEDVMTRRAVTIAEGDSLSHAAWKLERAGMSGAPVVRGSTVVGVVTLADLLRKAPDRKTPVAITAPFQCVEYVLADSGGADEVRSAMTPHVRSVMVDDPLVDAASLMVETRANLLPVVSIDGTLCGIVTPDDIVVAVAGSRPAGRDPIARRPRAVPD